MRLGLGPVFAYECLTGSRRWQVYAVRAGFVAVLLAALCVVWVGNIPGQPRTTLRAQAEVGKVLFYAVTGTQLVLVLLAAPAATAGAICLDRSRGTLTHLLVTDLSDAEIILGKLASRLAPVVGLVACALPVLALSTLLGGIDPSALVGAFLVALGVAMLGSALAFLLSLWVGKTHEALMGTYLVWGVWLLGEPIGRELARYGMPLDFPAGIDPFYLTFAPYVRPTTARLSDNLTFLIVTTALAALLAAVAVWRLRPVCTRESGRPARRRGAWAGWVERLRLPALPGPKLDPNPVLWREWHRRRPSPWARVVWGVFILVAGFFSVAAAVSSLTSPGSGNVHTAAWVNGLQVGAGLLLLSVSAATSLAEERVRGSLDVLLTTPLSTRSIVWAKWWGAFRAVPLLAILPTLVVGAFALAGGRWVGALLMIAHLLASGAWVASLGLALATWVPRLGRAVGLSVTIYLLVCVGWVFLCMAVSGGIDMEHLAMWSPFFGAGGLTWATGQGPPSPSLYLTAGAFWALVHAALATILLVLTLRTFDHCLGRMRERPDAPSTTRSPLDPALVWIEPGGDGAGRVLTGLGSRTPSGAGPPAPGAESFGRPPR